MTIQVVASPTIVILITLVASMTTILTTLEVSFMLLDNMYRRHLGWSKYFYSTGHCIEHYAFQFIAKI